MARLDRAVAGAELDHLGERVDDGDEQRPTRAEHETDRDQADPGGERDEHRLEHLGELRDAEAELALAGDQALEREPGGEAVQERGPARVRRPDAGVGEHEPAGEPGEAGAHDHEHVGGAPHGDVDAEGLVPDLVHREAGHRPDAEGAQRQHRPRHPEAGDAPAPVPPVEGGDDRAEHGSRQDAEQAEEDAGMRRGEELLVAPEGDVPGHVAVEADARDQQGEQGLADGDGGPTGDAGGAGEAPADALERAERGLVAVGGFAPPPEQCDDDGVGDQQRGDRRPGGERAASERARGFGGEDQHVTNGNRNGHSGQGRIRLRVWRMG